MYFLLSIIGTFLFATAASRFMEDLAFYGGDVNVGGTKSYRLLHVTGQASIDVSPDVAYVTLSKTNTHATSMSSAFGNNTAAIKQMVAAIRTLGINSSDIKTVNLRLGPKYRWDKAASERVLEGNRLSMRCLCNVS